MGEFLNRQVNTVVAFSVILVFGLIAAGFIILIAKFPELERSRARFSNPEFYR